MDVHSSNTAVSKIAQSIVSCASRNWFPCWANITTSTLSWNYRFYNIISRGDSCTNSRCSGKLSWIYSSVIFCWINARLHRCIQLLLLWTLPKRMFKSSPTECLGTIVNSFCCWLYVPRGIDSCKTSIHGRSNTCKLRSLPNASMSMCTHFPVLLGDS